MKKLIIISLLTAMLTVTAAGCNNTEASEERQVSVPVTQVQPTTEVSETSKGITTLYVRPDSCKIKISEKRLISVSSDKGAELSSDLVWSCDDESIATVDSSGNVIGKAPGDCVITVFRRDQPSVNVKIPITVKPNEESNPSQSSQVQNIENNQTDQNSLNNQNGQTSTVNEGGGSTTIINVIPPSGYVPYTIPKQYTYYYYRNNFSYSNPADGYVIYAMVSNYLSDADVSRITRHDAQMMINAIYAKHGYIFKDAEVRQFFETQNWYNSVYGKTSSMDTVSKRIDAVSMDRYNLNILLSIR